MELETFKNKFDELDFNDRLSIFNQYCSEYRGGDGEVHEFTDDFFNEMFEKPYDAARALFFGKVDSWSDDYVKFNAYGNLESMNEWDVEKEMSEFVEEIFDNQEVWQDYIDPYDYEDDEDDYEEETDGDEE